MDEIRIGHLRKSGFGNFLGLAYDSKRRLFYISHSSHAGPKTCLIYTIDFEGTKLVELIDKTVFEGNKVSEFNFSTLAPDAVSISSLSYRADNDRLYVAFVTGDTAKEKVKVAEISVDGKAKYSEISLDYICSGINVTKEGIWTTYFSLDKTSFFNYAGRLIFEISLADSFGGYPGPGDICDSFKNGLYVSDFYRNLIIELDENGKEIAAYSTKFLLDQEFGAWCIDTDLNNLKIFIVIGNALIFILDKKELNLLLTDGPDKRQREHKKDLKTEPIDISKLMDPSKSPWTRAKAKKFISSIIKCLRDDLNNSDLKETHLPKWVTHAKIDFGWIRNSLIFTIGDSDNEKDIFVSKGSVNTDMAVLLNIKDYTPIAVMQPLREGVREITLAPCGFDADDYTAPTIIVPDGYSFMQCGYMQKHGPIAVLGMCIRQDTLV